MKPLKLFPQLRYPLLVLGLLLLVNTLFRVIYLIYNANAAAGASVGEIFTAFAIGFRFDIATLFIINGLFFLFFSIPLKWLRNIRTYKIASWVWIIFNFPVLLANGIDVIYYSFSSKRTTHELFTSSGDLSNFSFGDFIPFWWIPVVLIGVTWVLFRLLKRVGDACQQRMSAERKTIFLDWVAPFVALPILFIGIRGGLQYLPLRPAKAFVTSNLFIGNLGLNSGYTILSSLQFWKEKPIQYFEQKTAVENVRRMVRNDFDGEFVSDEFPLVRKASFEGPENKYNIVFLIVESFNASYPGSLNGKSEQESLTPNLDSLARHGMLYSNFYANGTRSVESLSSILNSEPEIFPRPMIGSSYETNVHWGIGNILTARNYHTSFFCGGQNGTVGFDSYSALSGFNHYFGQNEYPGEKESINSKWGLHDGPVLEWMADMQSKFPEPFATTWFSISNHFPFDTPTGCPQEILNRKLRAVETTVMYTDYMIGQYFKKASQMPWFSRTIFVITGDHTLFGPDDPERSFMENFHVPLILIGPGVPAGRDDRLSCQLNLMPTMIELLRLDTYHAAAGVSLFSKTNAPVSLSNTVSILTLARSDSAYSTNLESTRLCYLRRNGKWEYGDGFEVLPPGNQMDAIIKSVYQVFQYTRIENKLFSKQWMQ